MTDLNIITSGALPTTKKYERAVNDLSVQMTRLKNVAAHTKLNVLQSDLSKFENNKKVSLVVLLIFKQPLFKHSLKLVWLLKLWELLFFHSLVAGLV